MNCSNCGAPLPPNTNLCTFCETVNDIDLRVVRRDVSPGGVTDRLCPHCNVNMQAVHVRVDGGFSVDRCANCMGLFFDPGEIEALGEAAIAGVYGVDFQRLAGLSDDGGLNTARRVTYIKCPICGELMNRNNYGSRSGVVVDECRDHGVWLDAGELAQLLKWIKAGGLIHDQQKKEQNEMDEQRQRRVAKQIERVEAHGGGFHTEWGPWPLIGLARVILRLLR